MEGNITEHFSWAEVIHSGYALTHNIPNILPTELENIVRGTAAGMERVRAALGNKPISVTSWYRSLPVNRAVQSKDTSQHIKGEAVDFTCPVFGTPVDICRKLILLRDLIRFDQLILEPSWVHISFAIATGKPRGQVLSLLSTGSYASGLTDMKGNIL